ncbi:unnamed protein product [Pleuronectes platessa]|uniref:Uncharacterized protein n=1 Tax=Pleuronectes platessa TaxID=8262 RepID=A0A9N7W350_PLEPL|nr:unnamed protein product [Pleuronectes platessa]
MDPLTDSVKVWDQDKVEGRLGQVDPPLSPDCSVSEDADWFTSSQRKVETVKPYLKSDQILVLDFSPVKESEDVKVKCCYRCRLRQESMSKENRLLASQR